MPPQARLGRSLLALQLLGLLVLLRVVLLLEEALLALLDHLRDHRLDHLTLQLLMLLGRQAHPVRQDRLALPAQLQTEQSAAPGRTV